MVLQDCMSYAYVLRVSYAKDTYSQTEVSGWMIADWSTRQNVSNEQQQQQYLICVLDDSFFSQSNDATQLFIDVELRSPPQTHLRYSRQGARHAYASMVCPKMYSIVGNIGGHHIQNELKLNVDSKKFNNSPIHKSVN